MASLKNYLEEFSVWASANCHMLGNRRVNDVPKNENAYFSNIFLRIVLINC